MWLGFTAMRRRFLFLWREDARNWLLSNRQKQIFLFSLFVFRQVMPFRKEVVSGTKKYVGM